MAVIILLLVASPGRAEPGQHSIFPDFAAAETPLNGGYTMPGFALCYQFDPIRYLPIGAVFSYQAPVKVNDAGLRYELYSLEGALYVGGRLAFDWMPGKTATGFLGTLRKILMANELQAGPILGVSHYVGLSAEEAEHTVRFSFGRFSTDDHVEAAVEAIRKVMGGGPPRW